MLNSLLDSENTGWLVLGGIFIFAFLALMASESSSPQQTEKAESEKKEEEKTVEKIAEPVVQKMDIDSLFSEYDGKLCRLHLKTGKILVCTITGISQPFIKVKYWTGDENNSYKTEIINIDTIERFGLAENEKNN